MKRLCIAAAAALSAASPVEAQSFLENMARRAAEGVANRAVSAAERGVVDAITGEGSRTDRPERSQRPTPRAQAADAGPTPRAAAPAASVAPVARGANPWPNNLSDPRLRRPGQMTFDAADEQKKQAFRTFGQVDCSDCEGGTSSDTAARIFLNLRDPWAFDTALGQLAMGQSLTWRGRASTGRITVVSEEAVGPFPCKQLQWELTRGGETAKRDGLVCLGRSNPDADNDRWMEIF